MCKALIAQSNWYTPAKLFGTIILGETFVDFFMFLAQLLFTTSEMELEHYQPHELPKNCLRILKKELPKNLRKLGAFNKIPEILGFASEYPARH